MNKSDPIILVDDDVDDCEILQNVLNQLSVPNPLICIHKALDALNYLKSTTERPFLILCDINMPEINGLKFREMICNDDYVLNKSIPFIFYSTHAGKGDVSAAYEMTVQGFFKKGKNVAELKQTIGAIYTYWALCEHPSDSHF